MSLKGKKDKKKPDSKMGAIVSDHVGNYEKHPYFVKKANEAKAFLKVVGLPQEFMKKPS